MPIAGKFGGGFGSIDNKINAIDDKVDALNDKLNPFSDAVNEIGKIPFYSTGARAFIKVGGKAIGVAQRIRWNVAYTATPIHTIDAEHAWDIDVGQARVTATLDQIIDPTKGAEADGLFHIMKSAIHQPYVEMQVLDHFGTSLFFSRGMFTGITGSIQKGQISTWSCNYVGVAYQHYVAQSFKPYDSIAGALSNFIEGTQNLASDLSGGIL